MKDSFFSMMYSKMSRLNESDVTNVESQRPKEQIVEKKRKKIIFFWKFKKDAYLCNHIFHL